jgi:F420-dependent oxidoreductase-like protein
MNRASSTTPQVRPRFGLQIPTFDFPEVPTDRLFETVIRIAQKAEVSGFDSVWVHDHLHQSPWSGAQTDPILEAYALLGAIAAGTSGVAIGSMVTPATTRNPALIAKMVTTLDVISGGRAVLGLGAGNHPDEHRGYGMAFPAPRVRLEMLEEAVLISRAMFTQAETNFDGLHFRLEGALNIPQPLQDGGPPILVGGGGERRTLRIAAEHADMCAFFGNVDTIRHKIEVLERQCDSIGRDQGSIAKTRLGALVIAPTQHQAEAIAEEMRAARAMGDQAFAEAIIGDPDRVSQQALAYLDAGVDGLFFNMHDAHNLEHVELAGATLSALFEERGRHGQARTDGDTRAR